MNKLNKDIDFEFIIRSMEMFAQIHEEKAIASRCFISRWWHRRKARKEIENAALIRRIQHRYESKIA